IQGAPKILYGLTLTQVIALAVGAKLSYEFSQVVPALPFKNFVFAHVHHLVPLALMYLLVSARESKTNLYLWQYVYQWLNLRFRNKIFVWKR
ncbi:MAG: hypothetical protein K6U74_20800, partial [Firmicutes bacterium]|nr:hypothetical protein [Bacillota bacterium]